MKENVLDVLVYLFEHFIYNDPESAHDRDSLQANLLEAGFSPALVSKAFDWLDELAERRPEGGAAVGRGPLRVYAVEEADRLDVDCRGFLMYLEREGVLDAARRELVLDRVMALDVESIDLDDLKWLVLMVLFNTPGQEEACAWMENHLFDEPGESVH
jgi:Smg protein